MTSVLPLGPGAQQLVIQTGGTIAAVHFDFVLNIDGKANNQGSETWQLVKASDGWRIASIVYSEEPPTQQQRIFFTLTQQESKWQTPE